MNATVQYAINAFVGLALAGVMTYLKRLLVVFRLIYRSHAAMLHNQLYRTCDEYMKRGWITVNDLEDLEELYACYSGLGMNGVGEKLYNDCKNLPVK